MKDKLLLLFALAGVASLYGSGPSFFFPSHQELESQELIRKTLIGQREIYLHTGSPAMTITPSNSGLLINDFSGNSRIFSKSTTAATR